LFTNNKLFLIPTDNLALLGFLNSKLTWFCLNQTAPILRGALALQSPYVLGLTLASRLLDYETLKSLTQQILEEKQLNAKADTKALEKQIDALIYEEYGLTREEIEMVER
jgi:hypothetical protein